MNAWNNFNGGNWENEINVRDFIQKKTLYNELGDKVTIYGIRDGYRGLIEGDYHEMLPEDFSDIEKAGGISYETEF